MRGPRKREGKASGTDAPLWFADADAADSTSFRPSDAGCFSMGIGQGGAKLGNGLLRAVRRDPPHVRRRRLCRSSGKFRRSSYRDWSPVVARIAFGVG
jgi:hypothetical protein